MAEWFSFQAPIRKGIPKRGEEEIGIPTEKVIEKSVSDKGIYKLKINYIPKGMWYKEIKAMIGKKDSRVMTLEMPESGVILEPGKPMLPIEGIFIALPAGAELVDIKVTNTESIEYPGEIDIIPAPLPTKDGGRMKYDHKAPEFKPDSKIYKKDKEFPKELFKLLSVNYIGSVRVAHLMMYPLHYKPKSKTLIIYNNIELKAEYTPGISIAKTRGPALTAPAEPPKEDVEPVAPAAPQIQMEYKSQILNLDSIEDLKTMGDGGVTRRVIRPVSRGSLCEISNKGRYIIITSEDLVDILKPLAKSKEEKGMSTQIITEKQIAEEFQESGEPKFKSIRDFILYAYDNWEDPPEYVLLVGEIGKIPTHHNQRYNCPSDWYYSNLIGDIGPDIVLGRIAINIPERLENYIKKLLKYEESEGNWIKRVLLTAYEREDYMSCSDDIAEILKKVRGLKVIKKYGGQSRKRDVIKEIEDGVGLVNYRGHGDEWEWQSSNGLDVTDVKELQNRGKIPVVFSICCLNNAIDVSAECFGEAFIEAPNGAVAFLGASRPSYTQPNHHFDRYIHRAIVDHNLRIVGKIFNFATITLYRNFPDQYSQENISMYLLLGDPSLEIKFPS
ncbi:MAG: hypothetical protein HWN66_12935 [Candidatus Helarchaeota archaeon]|nr:hypothetical protein [Candidatus Helarchaeota archaeon]